jgi:putative FmdB family regulatory protein
MPLYEYCCPNCLQHKDVRHGVKERPIVRCDNCKNKGSGIEMVKQLGTFGGFQFKGPGFFRNDYPKAR